MSKKLFLFIAVILPMCLATAIYLLFRSEELVVFQILNHLNLRDVVFSMREAVSHIHPYHWFALSLPGSLWMFSSMNLLLLVWKFNIQKQNVLWIFSPFVFAVALEILQMIHWTDGTFDATDVLMYSCGAMVFLGVAVLLTFDIKRRNEVSVFSGANVQGDRSFLRQEDSHYHALPKKRMHLKSLAYTLCLISVVYFSDKINAPLSHTNPSDTSMEAPHTASIHNRSPSYLPSNTH
ncbi:MAG: hypothetical protein NT150_07780 [Bacteroidetes bacterium]|nr:hypothetical protein [Bacteroidota bacterium]